MNNCPRCQSPLKKNDYKFRIVAKIRQRLEDRR